ncbi:MAG TPA: tetratricopeptide repeat protein [Vicinamibacterales bacterium]|nr:tetratricopeptide repeat protein [Vicinamibacterales bacterium]
MRHAQKLLTAFALAAALIVSALPAAAQTGRVGGTIKDDKGQPIKGATVTAENPQSSPSSFTTTTDDRGRFSIIGMRSGTWKITASAPGFMPAGGNVPIRTIGAPNPPVDITLAPGASAPTGALAGVDTKELQAELQKAEDLLNAQQYDEAIAAYNAILTKTPALTMINLQVGRAYRLKKDYDSALGVYEKMLEAEPNNERAKIEIGMTYLEKGDFAAAETALAEAAQSVSASREVFYNLGEVKFAKGETDEAMTWYKRASDMDPNWGKPLFKLGLGHLQKGDTKAAIETFEKVIAVDPNSQEAGMAKATVEQLKKGA